MKKLILFSIILGVSVIAAKNDYSPTGKEIFDYVSKRDSNYYWKLINCTTNFNKSVIYELELTSLKWHKLVWNHRLRIVIPAKINKNNSLAAFMIAGSADGRTELAIVSKIAEKTCAPAAVLHDVPNQPLFRGLREDALIAQTFLNFINNENPNDLLLFPMAKSVVKGMDTITDFCKNKFKINIDGFVTFGASKRGWTTWLSAVVDKRVKAIAPIVYDNLNLEKQMELQISDFGKFSDQIADYTNLGITEMMISKVPNAIAIGKMVDPFAYLEKINIPKLIIIGANDKYWPIDAINVYYKKLKGDTYIHYVPNTGHNLGRQYIRAVDAISELFKAVQKNTKLPKLNADYSIVKNKIKVRCTSTVKPEKIQAWVAVSKTKDFRESNWTPLDMIQTSKTFSCEIKKPDKKNIAIFVEAKFNVTKISNFDKNETFILSDKVKVF